MKVLVLHGAYGAPETNWFPWLSDRLTKSGHDVSIPKLPTPEGQSLEAWLDVIDESLDWPPPETVLVGHSLGAALALRLAERAEAPYAAAFLAAGFFGPLDLPDYDPINASFFEGGIDWSRAKRGAGSWQSYAGDNDPYVPTERSANIVEHVGGTLTIIEAGGHLNRETGFVQFARLADDIESFALAVK